MHIYVSTFKIYLDEIEADLRRNVSRAGSRDMLRWKRCYWFSTTGRKVFVFFGIKKTVWQLTLESLQQSIITASPKVNKEFPCYRSLELSSLWYHRIWVNYLYPFLCVIFWLIFHNFITQNCHKNQSNR